MDPGTDAPLTAAIVGGFAAIITAIIKFVPKTLVNGAGERFATKVELVELRARTATLERDVVRESKYTHDAVHDIRDYLQALEMDLTQAGVAHEVRRQILHEQRKRFERNGRDELRDEHPRPPIYNDESGK